MNEWFAWQVMLMAFWDSRGSVYPELGPDAHKEKQYVTQETYLDTLMHI